MDINEWVPEFKDKYFSLIMASPRRSGKSSLMKDLIINNDLINDYEIFVVFTNNEQSRDFYSEFIPGDLIFSDFNEDILENVKGLQQELYENGDKMKDILIIFDDCIGHKVKNNEKIIDFFCTGRHLNIAICMIVQDITLLKTICRDNTDIFIFFRQKSLRAKTHIIDNYMIEAIDEDEYPNPRKELKTLISSICRDHQCIIIDNLNEGETFNTTIFKYKAIIENEEYSSSNR